MFVPNSTVSIENHYNMVCRTGHYHVKIESQHMLVVLDLLAEFDTIDYDILINGMEKRSRYVNEQWC